MNEWVSGMAEKRAFHGGGTVCWALVCMEAQWSAGLNSPAMWDWTQLGLKGFCSNPWDQAEFKTIWFLGWPDHALRVKKTLGQARGVETEDSYVEHNFCILFWFTFKGGVSDLCIVFEIYSDVSDDFVYAFMMFYSNVSNDIGLGFDFEKFLMAFYSLLYSSIGPSIDFEVYSNIDIGLGFDFEKF